MPQSLPNGLIGRHLLDIFTVEPTTSTSTEKTSSSNDHNFSSSCPAAQTLIVVHAARIGADNVSSLVPRRCLGKELRRKKLTIGRHLLDIFTVEQTTST